MIRDPAILQAVIGALGTVVAAFVGVLTWYLTSRHDRRREQDERAAARRAEEEQRQQRVLDLVVALHSEILAGIVANRRQLTREDVDYAMAQDSPFATADETDFVFDSVKGDLSILPAETIHSVVQYYRAAQQSNLLTRDLRDPYFQKQSREEKRRIIALLIQIVEWQKLLGEAAIRDLADYAGRHGIDLPASEQRAETIIAKSREDLAGFFTISERSDPSLKPPSARRGSRRASAKR